MQFIEDTTTTADPTPSTADPQARKARRGPRRRTIALAVAGVVTLGAAGAAAAGGLFTEQARTSHSVGCADNADMDGAAYIGSGSGDPIADCTNLWRREKGDPVPPLVAHQLPEGGVVVVPAAAGTPQGARPLPPGFRQDVALIQLNHELDDVARGFGTEPVVCHTGADAERTVKDQLARLGLHDWTVSRDGGAADRCAVTQVDTEARQVRIEVRPESRPRPETMTPPNTAGVRGPTGKIEKPSDEAVREMARWDRIYADHKGMVDVDLSRSLAAAMISGADARCLSAGAADTRLNEIARQIDPESGLKGLMSVTRGWADGQGPDGVTTCVRPSVLPGGSMLVYLDSVAAPVPFR